MELVETFDWDAAKSPSLELLLSMSDLLDTHPTELEPLYNFVDPESLDRIFAPIEHSDRRLNGCIQFDYCDYLIEVHGSGKGYIYRRTEQRGKQSEPVPASPKKYVS